MIKHWSISTCWQSSESASKIQANTIRKKNILQIYNDAFDHCCNKCWFFQCPYPLHVTAQWHLESWNAGDLEQTRKQEFHGHMSLLRQMCSHCISWASLMLMNGSLKYSSAISSSPRSWNEIQ
jgi:hypothetical protein